MRLIASGAISTGAAKQDSSKSRKVVLSMVPARSVHRAGWREFLYSDDMAYACVYLMGLIDERYTAQLGSDESVTGRFEPPLVNIGVDDDVTIAEPADLVRRVVVYKGGIVHVSSKPDGKPRKLMDVGLVNAAGWRASTALDVGLAAAYTEFNLAQ